MVMALAWTLSPGRLCGNYNLMDVSPLRAWHLPETGGMTEHPSVLGPCQTLYTLLPAQLLSLVQMKRKAQGYLMQGSWTRVMKEDRLSNKPEHSSETGSPKPALPRLQTPKESDLLSPPGDRGSTALPRGH